MNYLHSPVTNEKERNNSVILLSISLILRGQSGIKILNRYMVNKMVPESNMFREHDFFFL